MIKRISAKTKALLQLLNHQSALSGNKLGEQLGISRAAVCKKIKELQALGINILAETAKGYRLSQPFELLDEQLIKQTISDPILQKNMVLDIHLSLPSTNDYLKTKFANCSPTQPPTFCFSEHQSSGRARLGRSWYAPFGVNIYCSSVWYFDKHLSELANLSLIVNLAAINTLKKYGITAPLHSKWPNDIICMDQKMAGILIDVVGTAHQGVSVIIGIGLNVNLTTDTEIQAHIDQPWTSLKEITQQWHDRNQLCGLLIEQLYQHMTMYRTQGFEPFLTQWQAHDYLRGKHISLQQLQQDYHGTVVGIDRHGHLLLQLADNSILSFAVGDAAIQKI